jgi:hypothetical protein
MNQKKTRKEVWAVEYADTLEFAFGMSRATASKRAKALSEMAPKFAPYRVVKFVRAKA